MLMTEQTRLLSSTRLRYRDFIRVRLETLHGLKHLLNTQEVRSEKHMQTLYDDLAHWHNKYIQLLVQVTTNKEDHQECQDECQDECNICFEEKPSSLFCRYACSHKFCVTCVKKCISQNQLCCSMCRTDIESMNIDARGVPFILESTKTFRLF